MKSTGRKSAQQLRTESMFTGRPIFAEDGKIRHIRSVVLITLALSCLQLPALGQQTYQWTGADNNQLWSDPVNWNPNGVPGQTCTNCSVDVPFPSGPYPIQNVSPLTIDSLTVASGERADMVDGDSITLTGSTLSGPLFMNNAGGATTTLNISIGSSVSYTNASNSQGLTMANNSSILGSGSLINQGMISYGGQSGHIGDGSLTFVNSAGATLISGGMGGSTSILSICPNVDWTNAGIIEAENGATLNINCGTITQSGSGQFSADNAKIVLADATIVGGLLASPSGGSFNVGFGSSATLENLTISGSYNVGDEGSTSLVGTITNNGTISLFGTDFGGGLSINSPVTLTGTGSVLIGGSQADITGSATLTNQQTIQGVGAIHVTTLDNEGPTGTIGASSASGDQTLTLKPGGGEVTNTGTITSLGSGAIMEISGGTVNNEGGTISSGNAGGFAMLDNNVTVFGGTISAPSNYVEGKLATLNGALSAMTINGPFNILGNDRTVVEGTFNGTGPINIDGCPNQAILSASGTTTFDIPMVLENDCSLNLFEGTGKNKVTINNVLSGNGDISLMILIIGPKGELIAGGFAGTPLIIDSSAELEVHGILIVDVNVILEIEGIWLNFDLTTDELLGGIYIINGTMDLPASNMIKTNNAKLTLNYPGMIKAGGVNALGQLVNNNGTIILTSIEVLDVGSPFVNNGTINIGSGSVLSAGGSGTTYSQAKGMTTDDGSLGAGNINITGGTLQGKNGVLQGDVTAGNAVGGATATFILGDDTKHAGAMSVSQNYTQLATGVLDAQIGGVNAGTQYSQLNVTGTATLGGTLNLKRINSFKPQVGQQFTLVNAASGISGTFVTVNGTSISATEHFEILYNSTTVVAEVVSGP